LEIDVLLASGNADDMKIYQLFLVGAIFTIILCKGSGVISNDPGAVTGTTDDSMPPNIGTGMVFTSIGATSLNISWGVANDTVTAQVALQYKLVKATTSAAIDTIAEVEAISGVDLLQDYSANDLTQNVTGLAPSTTYFFAVIVKDAAGNRAIYAPVGQMTAATDSTPPTLLNSTPANLATNIAPCTGNPCIGKIILIFSESMNTALTQTLTTEIWDGSAYVAAPNTNTTFVWSMTTSTNDTLTINISWLWFPENSQIRYTLAASGIQDIASNPIAVQIQRSFTTTTTNQSFVVADTGQTACYNGAGCPVAAYPGQDGDFLNIPAARSFTGPTQYLATSDYSTTDNVTTLVWKTCTEGLTGAACGTGAASTMTWYNALNQCSTLNLVNAGAGYAGKTNWRLPTARELETIPNFGNINPAVDTSYFPATVLNFYWSASTLISNISVAWLVDLTDGDTGTQFRTFSLNVRCVSGPTTVVAVITNDNGDGTVTDTTTGLRWQKCSRGQTNDATCSAPAATTATWQTALAYCDSLVLGGHANASNWRLPSVNEWKSIADRSKSNPAIDTIKFPNSTTGDYWSSSTVVNSTTDAWYMIFSNGYAFNSGAGKAGSKNVRCVSTGP